MTNENNKMQVDIDNLFKQNVNDLSSIKELYRKLKDIENKISQIKYIDSNLANKLKKDYENLKKIILEDVKTINSQMNEFKSQKYKGIAISITTNKNDYHLQQLNKQLNIAKQLKTNVQLALGVNMGNKNVTGNISLCVTLEQLQNIIDIVKANNLKVDMIKMHTQTVQGDWSGVDVVPTDINSFFSKYTAILNDVANVCTTNNIPILVMCNEQTYIISKSFYNNWLTVKETLKANYPNLSLSISYTLNRMREELRDYNLAYANSIPRLLDYIGINIYPTVLREGKRYNYGYMNKNQGLFNQSYGKESLYYKDSYLSIIKQVENFLGKVIITETGCIQYDTNTEIGDMKAISNTSLRTGTEGKDQELYFKEVYPYLNNISDGIYIWGANAPFTPVNEGLQYLKNKIRGDL